ncbi:hypothetical protein D9758_017187 [Tetrapyrgos nigripes]|uniref:RlpA-like protein double-psi beta-barrel domain-containing protein n=1 Tax=Tetrapyrgos nigripes TaxID=182062 RepID=A0A8H5BY80_9AGAR|nr:hypothetical protein D9758_017187 [Tetrapyrgos nigripes]
MFTAPAFSAALLALSALSASNAAVIPRKNPPPGWASGYLEDYQTYHTRYLALGCQYQHGKPFFDLCCHPLLATENLSDRDPSCTPSASGVSSALAYEATEDAQTTPSSSYSAAQAQATGADQSSNQDATQDQSNNEQIPSASPVVNVQQSQPTPSAASSSSSSSSSTGSQDSSLSSATDLITGGFGTYFYQNGVAGACGTVHSDNDLIVAMDVAQYGNTGVQSSLCGRQVQIFNTANGKSVTATVADACPTCNNGNSIDLSVGAFQQLADLSVGLINISWKLL